MKPRIELITSGLVLLMVFTYFLLNFNGFSGNKITGKEIMSTRLVIVIENESACDMNVTAGWNLVSFPCIYQDIGISTFLAGSGASYGNVRYYAPSDSSDPWKSYNPNLPSWVVQDLSTFSRAGGYWVYFENSSRLYINSTLGTPTLIDLVNGWNLIGYPSTSDKSINDTFGQIIPNFDYVYIYNASDPVDKWKQYTWNTSLPSDQDLNSSLRNFGYWVYMVNPDTIIIA